MYQCSHYLPNSNYLLLIPNFKVLREVAQRYIIVVMTMQINVKYRNFCMETRWVMHSDTIHLKEYRKANGTIFWHNFDFLPFWDTPPWGPAGAKNGK